jgi:hypothetical protein
LCLSQPDHHYKFVIIAEEYAYPFRPARIYHIRAERAYWAISRVILPSLSLGQNPGTFEQSVCILAFHANALLFHCSFFIDWFIQIFAERSTTTNKSLLS